MTIRKYIYIQLFVLLAALPMTMHAQTNRIYASDLQLETGEEGMLDIYMENTVDVVGLQFTLTVPKGITLQPQHVVTSERLAQHQLVGYAMGNNKYMFAAFSPTNETIPSIQGLLFSVPVQVPADMKDNVSYELSMTDAVMGTKDGRNYLQSAYGGKIFVAGLPNLHVTSVDCSDAIAGRKMTVTWRVRNDGAGPTRDVGWKDYVWLTPNVQGGTNMTGVKLLGTFDNVTALQPGEWYDNSMEVKLEERKYGQYHVVVTSDMYGFDKIDLSATGGVLPEVYQPETAEYGFLKATGTMSYDKLVESGESKGHSDNFFYKRISIAVPPLPNLRVDQIAAVVDLSAEAEQYNSQYSMIAPGLAGSTLFYSGKCVKVTARISNTGDATVEKTAIRNALYMSQSEDMSGTVYRMAQNTDTINIAPGASQTITFTTQLPYVWSGNTWFHVQADTEDAVYEGAATTDNIATGSKLDCLQTPTADFKVSSISAPKQVSLGSAFDVTYSVKNVGAGVPFTPSWKDRIYITKTGSHENATCIDEHRQTGKFVVDKKGKYKYDGDNYTTTRSVVLKGLSAGTYYLCVRADADDDVYEYGDEDNNWSSYFATVIVAPDLTAQLLSVSPDILYNKSEATFKWKVKNTGTGTMQNATLTDAFYAKSSNGNSYLLGKSTNTVTLAPGVEKTLIANVTLPNNSQLDGDMSVFVKTNTAGVPESNTGNNISESIPKSFRYETDPPANPHPVDNRPNLIVENVTASSTISIGAEVPISYQLKNIGAGTAGGQVTQEVYISQSASFNSQSAIPCTIVSGDEISVLLNNNEKKEFSATVKIPNRLKGGRYYLHVCVNRDGRLDEVSLSNNITAKLVNVDGLLPDLEITDLTIPGMVMTSVPFEVGWHIANIGSWESEKTSCDVWLMKDNKAVKLLKTVEVEALPNSSGVQKSVSVELEDDIVGDYAIKVVADSAHRQNELSRSNNSGLLHITSTQSPLPNLAVNTMYLDGRLQGGDTITITAYIVNKGENSTHKAKWSDAFYLSTGYELDTRKDLRIGSKIHVGELEKNKFYKLEAKLRIPENVHGYYFLYTVTDDSKTLIESSRTDNSHRMSVFIEDVNDRPAQLSVNQISAPANITAGILTSMEYSVVNNGYYPATGTLRDVIYLSKDNKWDEDDAMVGVLEDNVNILPGESLSRQVRGYVTNVIDGEYYVIVRTNSTHGIVESDYDDNQLVAHSPSNISIRQLPVGGTKECLRMGYYKVPVQSIGQSATLGFTLNHDSEQQAGLYVAYGRLPSTASYDYASTRLKTDNQEVLVPNVQPGDYYVLAQQNSISMDYYHWFTWSDEQNRRSSSVSEQPMSLSVREVQFGATRLSVTEGGTDGWVTTEVQGALFDSIMDFRLERNKQRIPIESLTYNDQTSARVIFNLNRAETGKYDVVSELPDGTQATLPNGFTVVPGVSSELGVKIDMPHWVRMDNLVPVNITYANSGNTDIVVRGFIFASEEGFLSQTIDGLTKNPQHEVVLLPNGRQDSRGYITIPPRSQGTMTCFFKQTTLYANMILYLVK